MKESELMKSFYLNGDKIKVHHNYIGYGKEGIVYYYRNLALKHFYSSTSTPMTEDICLRLSKIKTPQIITPLFSLYDRKQQFCGYASPYIGGDKTAIINYSKQQLQSILEQFKQEAFTYAQHSFLIRDAIPQNALLIDYKLYFIDCSAFQYQPNISEQQLVSLNLKRLYNLFIQLIRLDLLKLPSQSNLPFFVTTPVSNFNPNYIECELDCNNSISKQLQKKNI